MSLLIVNEPSKEDANRVYDKPGRRKRTQRSKGNKSRESHCYRRGSSGHLGEDPEFPARGQTCRKMNVR